MIVNGNTVGTGIPKADLMPNTSTATAGQFLRVKAVDASGRVTALETAGQEKAEVLWEGDMTFEPKYIEKNVCNIWSDHEPPAKLFYPGETIRFTVDGASKVYTAKQDTYGNAYFGNRHLSMSWIEGEGDTGDDFSITMDTYGLVEGTWKYLCFARYPGTYHIKLERLSEQTGGMDMEAAKEYTDTKAAEALAQAKAYSDSQRLAWTDTENVILAPEKEYVTIDVLGGDGAGGVYIDFSQSAPDKVVFTIDGTAYECVRKCDPASHVQYWGDGTAFAFEDNGATEPFIAIYNQEDNLSLILMFDRATSTPDAVGVTHTIGVQGVLETVHKIPEKYLPEYSGGMQVVELDLEQSCEELLNKIVSGGRPVILTFVLPPDGSDSRYRVSAVCSIATEGVIAKVECRAMQNDYVWTRDSNGWGFHVW